MIFAANAALAMYHSRRGGTPLAGPDRLHGRRARSASAADLLTQLQTIKVVRCDAVSLRVFGLSLANWNIFISGALAVLAARATFRAR